jgi:hypothetical protein
MGTRVAGRRVQVQKSMKRIDTDIFAKIETSIFGPPSNPRGTNNSIYHEGSLDSTSRFPYRIGADKAQETIDDAASARTVRFM